VAAARNLEFFRATVRHPWEAAKKWKEKTGGAAIGWLPADVPEELVMAAGALPVGVIGSEATVRLADAHLPVWACSFARTSLELDLRGELGFLDGLILPYTCDTLRLLAGIWGHLRPELRVHPYLLAHQHRPSAAEFVRTEMERLKRALQRLTGQEITPERLAAAAELVERTRNLLARLYAYHRRFPERLTNSDLFALLRAATLLPKEELLEGLLRLVRELGLEEEEEGARTGLPGPEGLYRVILSGSLAPPVVFGILEQAGLVVVGDDLHHGQRYLYPLPPGSDPFERLVLRQLALPPTGYHSPPQANRPGYLVQRARELQAQGVIFLHLRFCEPENYDYYQLSQALERENIPCLRLETDLQASAIGQIRTRLEAFAEMLGGEYHA
jgi:benzoyl-CoA reductase/2-hydroxyglutaryl-CoA dehydratase subunit BcrC/BadD/HgdB